MRFWQLPAKETGRVVATAFERGAGRSFEEPDPLWND